MGISTHMLDTSEGRPAEGVAISLSRAERDGLAALVFHGVTDRDGRCRLLVDQPAPGTYTLRFETASYYATKGIAGLYPYIEIAFEVARGQAHYHIPLLLTANGYTTYRGS